MAKVVFEDIYKIYPSEVQREINKILDKHPEYKFIQITAFPDISKYPVAIFEVTDNDIVERLKE